MRLRTPVVALLAFSTITLACTASDPAQQPSSDTGRASGSGAAGADSAFLVAADRSRILGADSANVWMLIVSDFQCPYCRIWHEQTYDAIAREYVQPGRVRMAYINLPSGSHEHAMPAAEAAMCAGVQGKFWQVTDGIFRTQERWSQMPIASAVFDSVAGAQQLDMPAWRKCVSEHRTQAMIEADAARAREIGISSTPSFIVMRGQEVVRGIAGAYPADTFRVVLDAALAGTRAPAPR